MHTLTLHKNRNLNLMIPTIFDNKFEITAYCCHLP